MFVVDVAPPMCRICLEEGGGRLVQPCACTGSSAFVHRACLREWRMRFAKGHVNRSHCTVCLHKYNYTEYEEVNALLWGGYFMSLLFAIPAFVSICPIILQSRAPFNRIVTVPPRCPEQFVYAGLSILGIVAFGVALFMGSSTRVEQARVYGVSCVVPSIALVLCWLFDGSRLALPILLGLLLFLEQVLMVAYLLFECE